MIPEAEWTIDVRLVQDLVNDQFPRAQGGVTAAGSGWDNALFRVGEHWGVRLPRRAVAVELIEKEHRWLPVLAPSLTLPIPLPVHRGRPTSAFPWPWTVQPWLAGSLADAEGPGGDQAPVLAEFWRGLHTTPPAGAPTNPFRGGPLVDRVEAFEGRCRRLKVSGWAPGAGLSDLWREALDAPLDLAPTWIHADLHPRNVLVQDGRLCGVLDWGDLATGDPATDLASAWMLFDDPKEQTAALGAYGVSEATLVRALGWAAVFGVMFLDAGRSESALEGLGSTILRRAVRYWDEVGPF